MHQDTLLHGKTVVSTTDSDHTILPFFTTSINSNLCGQTLHIKYYVYVHGPLSELLAVSGRETWSFTFMSWLPRRLKEKKFKSNFFKQNFIWWKYANSTQWWIPENLAREEKSWVCLPQRSIFVHLHFLREGLTMYPRLTNLKHMALRTQI